MKQSECCTRCTMPVAGCFCTEGPTTHGSAWTIACPYCGHRISEDDAAFDEEDVHENQLIECTECGRESKVTSIERVVEISLERLDEEFEQQLAELRGSKRAG